VISNKLTKEFLMSNNSFNSVQNKKRLIEMIASSTILYIIYVLIIFGGFLALGYHLYAGEEED
jgi:hypothetical protein